MNIFTLLLLFVCVAFSVSDETDHNVHRDDSRGCRSQGDHRDHHDDRNRPRDDDEARHHASHSVTEGDVIRELLARHVDTGLPNYDGTVRAGIGLFVEAITEVNEAQGYMEMSGFLSIQWTDPRLRFRYGHPFHEVHDVRLSRADVWVPDLELYNLVSDGMTILNTAGYQVVVEYNGTVKWFPMITTRAKCVGLGSDSDQVQCELRFGSWTYNSKLLDWHIMQSMPSLSQYHPSGEWVATDVTSKRVALKYPCCPEEYVYISFILSLKRKDQ